jgi:paraquat-inducible protein A
MRCPRCGAALSPRQPASLVRTWAFLIAAYVLIVPANLLPVMETGSLFGVQKDTILSGIAYLWHSGSWFLAIVVFLASIVVPLAKLLALSYLAWPTRRRRSRPPLERARLYRLVKYIGRWSMLDLYVIALLSAVVRLKSMGTITPQPGAAAFAAVVVLTLLAAWAFDPRLIWDSTEPGHG